MLGFCYAAVVIVAKLVYDNAIEGWTPLMVVVLVMGGIQMLMLGVVGEYLWRTLQQTRNRDAYVIEPSTHHSLDRPLMRANNAGAEP